MTRGSRSRFSILVSGAVIACLIMGGSALASSKSELDQCFGPGPLTQEEAEMKCVKSGDGEWTAVGGDSENSGAAGLIFLAIVMALVAGYAGMSVAGSRGLSPGLGFVAGLAFSWLGVLGVYLYGESKKSPA